MLHRASINLPTLNSWRRSGLRMQARSIADSSIYQAGELDLWASSHDLSGVTASLETWVARVGVHPTQPAAGLRPAVALNNLGRYDVTFDGVGQALVCGVDLSSTGSVSVFVDAYTNAVAAAAVFFNYGMSPIPIIGYFNSQKIQYAHNFGTTTGFKQDNFNLGNTRTVAGFTLTSDTSPNPADIFKVYDHTARPITSFTKISTTDAPINFNVESSWLGSVNNGASAPLDGGMSEVLVYLVQLSAAAALAVSDAVTQKHTVGW